MEALCTQSRLGGPAKLADEQREQIPALLACEARAYGFQGDVWTANRIASVTSTTSSKPAVPIWLLDLAKDANVNTNSPYEVG